MSNREIRIGWGASWKIREEMERVLKQWSEKPGWTKNGRRETLFLDWLGCLSQIEKVSGLNKAARHWSELWSEGDLQGDGKILALRAVWLCQQALLQMPDKQDPTRCAMKPFIQEHLKKKRDSLKKALVQEGLWTKAVEQESIQECVHMLLAGAHHLNDYHWTMDGKKGSPVLNFCKQAKEAESFLGVDEQDMKKGVKEVCRQLRLKHYHDKDVRKGQLHWYRPLWTLTRLADDGDRSVWLAGDQMKVELGARLLWPQWSKPETSQEWYMAIVYDWPYAGEGVEKNWLSCAQTQDMPKELWLGLKKEWEDWNPNLHLIQNKKEAKKKNKSSSTSTIAAPIKIEHYEAGAYAKKLQQLEALIQNIEWNEALKIKEPDSVLDQDADHTTKPNPTRSRRL